MNRPIYCFLLCLVFVSASSFKKGQKVPPAPLATVQVIDRNGMAETVSNPDRLKAFKQVDFLKPQPYQKVIRIHGRDKKGEIHSYLTTYHENGTVKQYLEAVNGRASGTYREWHPNGTPSLATHVVNGMADLSPGAEQTWLFNGTSQAWDNEGNLVAHIQYEKGNLEGISTYYHRNGKVWKRVPCRENVVDGDFEIYFDNGTLLQTSHYDKGVKKGPSIRFWADSAVAAKEEFVDGRLSQGIYHNRQGDVVAEVVDGTGLRAVFGRSSIAELHEYRNGVLEGTVSTYSPQGVLISRSVVKDGKKNGEEIEFYPSSDPQPRLSISWKDDRIHGWVKSWYDNGVQESQKEMANNEKNGLLTCWYRDGSIMMIEEYEHDKLMKGEYFRKGERDPVSQVFFGDGVTSLFDADGCFLEKVTYHQGKPCDS